MSNIISLADVRRRQSDWKAKMCVAFEMQLEAIDGMREVGLSTKEILGILHVCAGRQNDGPEAS